MLWALTIFQALPPVLAEGEADRSDYHGEL